MFRSIKRYVWGVLIGIDQMGNALAGGNPDETISSRIGRLKMKHKGRIPWHHPLARFIDSGLEVIDRHHSMESIDIRTAPDKNLPYAARIQCPVCYRYMTRYICPREKSNKLALRYCPKCEGDFWHMVAEVYND